MIPIPSIAGLNLYAGVFLAGLAAGGYAVHTWHKAQRADAIDQARTSERALQRSASQSDVRYVDRLHDQVRHAQDNATAFRRALNATNDDLARCRVDAELVRLLDDAGQLPGAAGHPAEPRPGSARAAATPASSSCDVELERCRANYAEVCVPNAIHVRELRAFTRRLIQDYNRATGRE